MSRRQNLEPQQAVSGTPGNDVSPALPIALQTTQENQMTTPNAKPLTKPAESNPPAASPASQRDKSAGNVKPSSKRSARQGEKKSTP